MHRSAVCPRHRKAINLRVLRAIPLPRRHISARSDADLKKHLRKFYRRVHPDIFSARPSEKRVNEASFKLLMSMMQETDTDLSLPSTHVRLEFYVMPPAKTELLPAELPDQSVIVCPKISVEVNLSGSNAGGRKTIVRSAVHSLLTQSGILDKDETEKSVESEFKDTVRNAHRDLDEHITVSATSLAQFVLTYADLARRRRKTYAALDREVGLLRSMLWINFRVRLAFDVGPLPPTLEAQSELVAQLHDVITSVGPSVHDSTVCLATPAPPTPIDPAGRIVLPIDQPDAWLDVLKTRILAHEKACATALGIGTVAAETFKFSTAPEYDRFLNEMVGAGERNIFEKLNKNLYGQLSMRVMAAKQGEAILTTGFAVPHDVAASELEAFMRENSAAAVRAFKKFEMERKRDDDTLRFVRRQLMAHGIKKHESVTAPQMREALARLRGQEGVLGPHLRGVDLKVGSQYCIYDDGTMEVPWDFNKR